MLVRVMTKSAYNPNQHNIAATAISNKLSPGRLVPMPDETIRGRLDQALPV
jgi:hypothetical protein